MRVIPLELKSETRGLVGQPFDVLIYFNFKKQEFNVKMKDDLTDIAHHLTDAQLLAVVLACGSFEGPKPVPAVVIQ